MRNARSIARAALLASLLATCGADCSSLTSDPPPRTSSSDYDRDRDYRDDRDNRDERPDRDDRYFNFAGTILIPKRARQVTEGKGELTWTADRDGIVYVADVDDRRSVLEKQINKGEKLVLDAKDDRVRIGGRTVAKPKLEAGHKHRIYFERD